MITITFGPLITFLTFLFHSARSGSLITLAFVLYCQATILLV